MNLDKYMPFVKFYPPKDPYYTRVASMVRGNYSDAEPFKLISVDPDDIEYVSLREFDKWERSGQVLSGDWDRKRLPFEEATFYTGIDTPFFGGIEAHFERGADWEETEFVREVTERIRSGHRSWGCSSLEEVWEKADRLDALYDRIADQGYKSQAEYLSGGSDAETTEAGSKLLRIVKRNTILGRDEVAVDIGRDGELLYFDGKHRLSIAKLLDVESIPVRVVVRHRGWQDVRDEIRETGTVVRDELRSHPDLVELTEENASR